jgi:hypothetical protein
LLNKIVIVNLFDPLKPVNLGLGLILAHASLSAQRLCFNQKNGEVRYLIASCGRGFKEVKSVIRSVTLKDGSAAESKLPGNIICSKIYSSLIPSDVIPWGSVQKPNSGIPGSQIENLSVT